MTPRLLPLLLLASACSLPIVRLPGGVTAPAPLPATLGTQAMVFDEFSVSKRVNERASVTLNLGAASATLWSMATTIDVMKKDALFTTNACSIGLDGVKVKGMPFVHRKRHLSCQANGFMMKVDERRDDELTGIARFGAVEFEVAISDHGVGGLSPMLGMHLSRHGQWVGSIDSVHQNFYLSPTITADERDGVVLAAFAFTSVRSQLLEDHARIGLQVTH